LHLLKGVRRLTKGYTASSQVARPTLCHKPTEKASLVVATYAFLVQSFLYYCSHRERVFVLLKIVIAGGGTGGHCLPALAVIEEFQRRNTEAEWLWIGSSAGVEADAAKRAGVPFRSIETGKLRRYFSLKTITDAFRMPIGAAQAWRVLRGFQPDVIFSTGGFVSVPTVFAGSRTAPIITHEQTAILGLATKLNLRFADVLAVSYEDTFRFADGWRGQTVVTGNAVRRSFDQGNASRALDRFGFSAESPLLYVTGGARGASAINHLVAKLLPNLLDRWNVLHQAGPASANDDATMLRSLRASWSDDLQRRYQVVEFVNDEIADVYCAASLVLSRAGAGTVAELAYLGKPSILIPLPGTGGDEQRVNANVLGNAGGAIVIDQSDATSERIESELNRLACSDDELKSLAVKAKSVGKPDAAAKLTDLILSMVGQSSS
jgi:UDP-N-acetylglucosamine--N-acetylmuramyl-(pentapeptide) pyrophosphoryl-undecaprenol N-acetylglucosamine transferase